MSSSTCTVCHDTRRIQKDHEIICRNCGTVCDIIQYEESDLSPSHHTSHKLGSENLIDPQLKLVHINKNRTKVIMENTDKQLSYFVSCCDVLGLRKFVADTAITMFRTLRPYKLGMGKTVVFCIYHACITYGILINSDEIIKTVRYRFGLKRIIKLSDALYSVKPTALELRLISLDAKTPDSFTLKKHVLPKHHIKAVKIINSFSSTDMKQKAKNAQKYLECYD